LQRLCCRLLNLGLRASFTRFAVVAINLSFLTRVPSPTATTFRCWLLAIGWSFYAMPPRGKASRTAAAARAPSCRPSPKLQS
jgi:hypothetical protein